MGMQAISVAVLVIGTLVVADPAKAECRDWYLYCQSLCGTKTNKWCAAGSPYSCMARYGECKQSNIWKNSYGGSHSATEKAPKPVSSR
jgi:hypothetical protein